MMMLEMQCSAMNYEVQYNSMNYEVQCNAMNYQVQYNAVMLKLQCSAMKSGHLPLNKVLACCLILQEEDFEMGIEMILKQEVALFNKCCLSDFNFKAIS